jgi:hypothetical protein
MSTVLIWTVVGIGLAGLAASIWIGEHGPTVEPPAQDEELPIVETP